MTDTSQHTTLMQIALAAHDAGLSIIPIKSDGSKKPPFGWKQFQTERATRDEVRAWFAPGRYQAAAVVCGEVSGWLVMIEMEGWAWDADLWPRFRAAAVAELGEDRWSQITRYIERSPSGGVHFYVRAPGVEIGNVKLAMRTRPDTGERVVAMETRGKGGYSVIAPSTGHATGLPWTVAQGVLSDIAEVTEHELHVILEAAGTLHEGDDETLSGEAGVSPTPSSLQPADASPGLPAERPTVSWMDAVIEEFNDTLGFHGLLSLLPGWSYLRDETLNGETVTRLHRDGSDNEHGAVVFQSNRVAFFSSNCPSWAEPYDGIGKPTTYDAFTVMMYVEKGGNSTPARVEVARELRVKGFGPAERHSDGTTVDPDTGEISDLGATSETDESLEGDGTAPTTLRLRWVEDALANMPPEPEPVVTNLLRRGEVTVLGAPRAIGKTWASLNLATILAQGEGDLFGSTLFQPAGQRRVLYLQGELGEWGSASRWEMTCADQLRSTFPPGQVAETFERVRIRTTHRKVTDVSDGVVYEDTHTDAVVDHRLEPAIEAGNFDVLVIDPWATFFAGNENNNDETEAAIVALTDIARRQNIAVWIVHHISAKTQHSTLAEPEDLWRGASRLADAVATRVTVLPHYTAADAKKAEMDRMTARKFIDIHVLERNGPPIPMLHAQREGVWWKTWVPPTPGRPSELSQHEVALKLRQAPGKMVGSKRQLCDLLGKSHSAVDRVIEGMIDMGLIETVPGARNSVGYRLIESG